jgi:hypothetical protein
MSKGNTFENDLLELIFNATAIANIADNAGTSPLTNLYVALHTSDPGEAGNQTTNECAYTSYARVAVARTSGGWTITANSVSPTANIDFSAATGGTETATHVSIGTDSTGTGKILYYGAITPNISISTGVTPRIGTGTTITED